MCTRDIIINMKKREILILVIIACLSLAGLFFLNRSKIKPNDTPSHTPSSSTNNPEGDPKGEWIGVIHRSKVILWFDSGVDDIYTVEGLVGKMDIEVKNGEWHISYVDCPNHTCEKMGWMNVDTLGVPITCLPNDILIVPKTMIDNMDLAG